MCIANCPFSDCIESSEIKKYIDDPKYAYEILKDFEKRRASQTRDRSKLEWLK